ncbi:MAG TPA: AbfB domain-containing protein [Telluria sp.]|jgi:hypothetical protein
MQNTDTWIRPCALSLSMALTLLACGGSSEQGSTIGAPGKSVPVTGDAPAATGTLSKSSAMLASSYPLAMETDVSLQVLTPGLSDRYLRHAASLAGTEHVDDGSSQLLKNDASFRVVAGLADASCYSLRSRNYPNSYVRHQNFRVRVDPHDNSDLFKRDATFCARPGLGGNGVSFEALSMPGHFLRHYYGEAWMAAGTGARPSDSAASFAADATWNIANAWGWEPLEPMAAPPAMWQEHWFDHKQNLSRVFYNNDIAVYVDGDVDRTQTWMNSYITNAWRYTRRVYGDFGDDRLFAVFHTNKYNGGHPATRFDASHDHRNMIDVGPGPWRDANDLGLITHEIAHIVELGSKGVQGSPAFGIWGDSKWAEIYTYDLYRGLGLRDQELRAHDIFMNTTDDFPRAGTHWFRDWFLPIYNNHGKTAVLNNYFALVARCYPRQGQNYTRQMNWGEFVHFWSGAAGVNLKQQATVAFGWNDEWDRQLIQAQGEFACAAYRR